jgi:hypothetical protein
VAGHHSVDPFRGTWLPQSKRATILAALDEYEAAIRELAVLGGGQVAPRGF